MLTPRITVAAFMLMLMTATCYAVGLPDATVIDKLTGVKGKANEKEGVYTAPS